MKKPEANYLPGMKWIVLLFMGSTIVSTSWAQTEFYGCHAFQRKMCKVHAPDEHAKVLINESIARSDTFDILHYAIQLDVTNYTAQFIRGATTITFEPIMEGQSHIRFDLFELEVDSVTWPQGVLPFLYNGTHLRIDFPEALPINLPAEVTVYYKGNPHRDPFWGGFYFEANYIYNLGIGLTTIPPNFGKVWYPCFDSFVERATYECHVKSAGGRRFIGQGLFLGEQQLEGDTLVRSYLLDQPIPTHISAIAVADYELHEYTHQGQYGEVPVTLAARPAQLSSMITRFANLGAAIDACEYWYGPQPFDRVGYVLTTDGALEIPTNIAYPQFMTGQGETPNRNLYSHELGHHWWGDRVVMKNHTDMWMKEGPAEYSSHLVTEWLLGREAFVDQVKDNQLFVLERAHVEDNGFEPLSGISDEQIYGVHTYNKGAAVLHNLRGYLGDALFRQGMSGVAANYGWTDFTAEEFRDALENETGAQLDDFFDAWIFEPGFSVFVVDSMLVTQGGGGFNAVLYVQQQLRATESFHRNVPLDITLIGAGWQSQDYLVTADNEFTTLTLDVPFEPVMAVINRHNRLNQGRMDHEFVIRPEENFPTTLPYVDFRVYDNAVPDSALVRVEHIWAAPDPEQLGPGVFEISGSHYWIVDGLWPQGLELEGRVYYDGAEQTDLDYGLFGVTEEQAVLVYRATPADPWTIYPDYDLSAGNLFSGTGNFEMTTLRKGQYAFAKGDPALAVPDLEQFATAWAVYPVPASDEITLAGQADGQMSMVAELFALDGRKVWVHQFSASQAFRQSFSLNDLSTGSYLLRVRSVSGRVLHQQSVQVVR
jgi:aminopeptidase N